MMLVAMVLSVLGATSAFGQKTYKAELDDSMFKAWTSNEPGAQVDPEPAAEPKNNASFNCENNLYKEVGGYGCIWGSSSVYYLWYADITGTKTMTVTGTVGMKIRVMLNREPYVEGGTGDLDGGAYVELIQEIGENGTTVFDFSTYEYLHLNAIKVPGDGPGGVVRSIILEGTVQPVTGLLSVINNGDAEGTDLSSFPVSHNGGVEGVDKNTADDVPEIVEGGVSGKCLKVVSDADPVQTWGTQFFIKADEVMPKGSKWRLIMSIKADRDTKITTSAQAQPREWKGGFVSEFQVGTEWKQYEWSGEIGVDDFQSIAFDLNNGDERNANDDGWAPGNGGCGFYFDNIEFGYDLGGSNPMSQISANVGDGVDAVQINFNDMTNLKDMVKASGKDRIIYPNEAATVTWNGVNCEIASVEGRDDGNLYIFLVYDDKGDTQFATNGATIEVAFKNPADATQILFTAGKWEGEPVPEFSKLQCVEDDGLENYMGDNEYYSYIWGAPVVESAVPEEGSFNLPADTKQFVITFNQDVKLSSVQANLSGEKLTASAEGDAEFAKTITLTRTGTAALAGAKTLAITSAVGVQEDLAKLEEAIEIKYSFGPVSSDEEPAVIYAANFTENGDDALAPGWMTTADNQDGLQPASSGSGNRLQHGQTGYTADVLYLAQRSAAAGIALYGTEEGYKLELQGGTTYHLTLKSAQWDAYPDKGSNRTLRVQILTEDAVSFGEGGDGSILDEDGILAEEFKVVDGRIKENKEYTAFDIEFTPPTTGNYIIRMVAGNLDGNPAGFGDGNAIGDVKVEYIPDVMGIVETKALNEALEAAKAAYDEIATASAENNDRYDGTALTALKNLIDEVEKDKVGYSAPSLYAAKTTELGAAVKAANDHKAVCDSYDEVIKQGIELVDQFKESKFAVTSYYTDLTAVVNKYHGQMEKVNVSEDPEEPIYETNYSFDVLKDDDALAAANTEVSTATTMASKMFTEGKSSKGWQQITTGYAALHERLRRGVELLKSLGVDESEEVIAAANAELGDNDEIAEAIIKRANQIILADLASGESKLFEMSVDDETGIESSASYDLSVFFKNPNVYGPANSTETPGWTSVVGNCYAWSDWDGAKNHSANTPYPEDCDIHAGWHPNPYAMVEQTVENLPVGIYTVKIKCNDNGNSWESSDAETPGSNTCAFIRTSESPEIEPGADIDRETDFYAYITGSNDIEEVPVVDGKLSVGFYYGNTSQAFFEDVEVWMTAPIAGHDYGKDYQEVLASVETAKTAKVRGLELYDLNGRRITTARKGLVIVKKYMSDGTVKTEKVIK